MSVRPWSFALLLVIFLCPGPVSADQVDATFGRAVYQGPLAAGVDELGGFDGPKARLATGVARVVLATERLIQALYRHGLSTPRAAIPVLRVPVPTNARPSPITYEAFRTILVTFDSDLAAAQSSLEAVGDGPVKLPVDLAKVRVDMDGDGTATDKERLWTVLSATDPRMAMAATRGGTTQAVGTYPVTLDEGDVDWLLGYVHVLRAVVRFWTAHDFSGQFEQTYHTFFPRAGLPFSNAPMVASPMLPVDGASLADLIAFVHLLNCPVSDRAMLLDAVGHLRAVPALSRRSWAKIQAETDDDDEWLPNPRQTNRFATLPVTQERIDAWIRAMDAMEAVLDGRKLVPHWRLAKGLNLRRALTEHERFDPVLWTTGTGLAPFLEDGPVIPADEWAAIVSAFRGNFAGYALWFN